MKVMRGWGWVLVTAMAYLILWKIILAAPQNFIPRETLYTFWHHCHLWVLFDKLDNQNNQGLSISIYGQIKYFHGSRATNMWFPPYLKEMVLAKTVISPLTDENGRLKIWNTGSQPTEIHSQWGQRPQ